MLSGWLDRHAPAAIVPAPPGTVIHRIGHLIERHADELAMLETLGGLPV
jgi:hypothetical protein